MAREAIVMFRCDGCGKTGGSEPYPEDSVINPRFRSEWIPEGWVELRTRGNKGGDVLNMHLCVDCDVIASGMLSGLASALKPVEDSGIQDLLNWQGQTGIQDLLNRQPRSDTGSDEARSKESATEDTSARNKDHEDLVSRREAQGLPDMSFDLTREEHETAKKLRILNEKRKEYPPPSNEPEKEV
jgi:hypothetical protein